jgi:ribosome biogenesis GTPase
VRFLHTWLGQNSIGATRALEIGLGPFHPERTNPLDENYKRSIKSSFQRQIKKTRSREERQILKEVSKQRSREKGSKKVRHKHYDEDPDEESAPAERMRSKSQTDLEGVLRAARQENVQQVEDDLHLSAGTVISVARNAFRVRAADGAVSEVEFARAAGQPAVGDEVRFAPASEGFGRLRSIKDRRSVISRPDPHNPNLERVLAANVDVAVIVAAVRQPDLRAGLIDRFLIAIERGGARPLICANKSDLVESAAARQDLEDQLAVYRELGVEVLWTSAQTLEGGDELALALEGQTCVFVGHSGVGKSALLNTLDPERGRGTGSGREFDGKGKHTTTSSELVDLPNGTRLIDTPGIRNLGLWQVTRKDLAQYFPDFEEFVDDCKFRDCSHLHEPDCGVRGALERGQLHAGRFATYLRLGESLSE